METRYAMHVALTRVLQWSNYHLEKVTGSQSEKKLESGPLVPNFPNVTEVWMQRKVKGCLNP